MITVKRQLPPIWSTSELSLQPRDLPVHNCACSLQIACTKSCLCSLQTKYTVMPLVSHAYCVQTYMYSLAYSLQTYQYTLKYSINVHSHASSLSAYMYIVMPLVYRLSNTQSTLCIYLKMNKPITLVLHLICMLLPKS